MPRDSVAGIDSLIFRLEGNVLRLARPVRDAAGGARASGIPYPPRGTRWLAGRYRRATDDPRRGSSALPEAEFPETQARARGTSAGHRTYLATPLLREGDSARDHRDPSGRGPALLGQADRASPDVRRPGRHRHRERPAVHGAAGEEPGAHGSARQVTESLEQQTATARSCGSSRAPRPICSRSWRPSPRTPPGSAGRTTPWCRTTRGRASCTAMAVRGRTYGGRFARPIARPFRRRAVVGRPCGARPRARPRAGRGRERLPSTRRRSAGDRGAFGARAWPSPRHMLRKGAPIGVDLGDARRGRGRSPTTRSSCSRPSPTRR